MNSSKYEIEWKAFLTEEKYKELLSYFSKNHRLISEDEVYTIKFEHPSGQGDIRLRKHLDYFELVLKDKNADSLSRKETTIKLASEKEFNDFKLIFEGLKLKSFVPWITYRKDFEFIYENYSYEISIQNIENYAKLIKVEFLTDIDNDKKIHEKNIKNILRKFGCEPVSPVQLIETVEDYNNKKLFK